MTHDPYGPAGNATGTLFWLLAIAAFTFPFWAPLLGFVIGLVVGMSA